MNLAKIRRKFTGAPIPAAPDVPAVREKISEGAVPVDDQVDQGPAPEKVILTVPSTSPGSVPVELPVPPRREAGFDPLQILLAGREASGCNEDAQTTTVDQAPAVQNDYGEYLCFRVSDETYGINIMQIKEIIKPRAVTEVPRAPSFVAGVISLRGVIIPVIDMIGRLGLRHEHSTGKERVVVVKTGEEYAGLLVDEVVQVVRIPFRSIESTPAVLEGIDRDFVSGIGRADTRMVILLNVESIADINLY